jgi:cell division protein FtsW
VATVWSRRSRRDAANGAPVGGESTDAVDEMVDESVPDEADADALSAESEPSARTAATANTDGTIRKFLPPLPFGAWLARPMTSFHLMISVATLLTILGLIMVLSASGVHSYDEDGSPWSIFIRQLMWAGIGIFACWVALRLPVRFLRVTAFPAFATTMVLLVAVLIPGIGRVANGTRGWFSFAGLSMQPSELTKIAFLIWGSHILAARRMERASLREMLIPLLPAAVTALALIVAEPDLGQTVSLGIILLALLWFAGLPLKVFVSSLLAAVSAAAVLAVSAGYRSDRVRSWLDPSADAQGAGYQARQAKFALANGGVFGDGLGQGTAKWNYLPNAHNDFIFAIIGEELGFIGAFGLLCLFGLFAYTGMRIARRSADPFLRLMTATATAWVVGQVFINVGYVIGLLPVTGIQLPLISAGGTSTSTTLFMIGLMANAARHEPDAVAALRAGRDDRMNRLLRLPLPEPYLPSRVEVLRERLRSRPAPPKKAGPPARGAKAGKPAKKPAAPARRPEPRERVRSAASGTGRPRAATGAKSAKTGTANGAGRASGHHGDASGQRRAAAAQGRRRTGNEHQRRSRALEGQRYG